MCFQEAVAKPVTFASRLIVHPSFMNVTRTDAEVCVCVCVCVNVQ